jgi:hypothetical protein
MDTDQLNDEQRYYKEKYFKYKLKYVTLKKQLEGGGRYSRHQPKAEVYDERMETFWGKQKFSIDIAESINKYFEAKYYTDELYTKLKNKNIFIEIYNVSSTKASTISGSIDIVLRSLFPNDNDESKKELKKYLWDIIKKFYKIRQEFKKLNLNKENEQLHIRLGNDTQSLQYATKANDVKKMNLYKNNIDLYNILIKNKFFDKNGALEEELNKNKYIVHETIYTVIDAVLKNITNDYNRRQELKSFLIDNYFSSFR